MRDSTTQSADQTQTVQESVVVRELTLEEMLIVSGGKRSSSGSSWS